MSRAATGVVMQRTEAHARGSTALVHQIYPLGIDVGKSPLARPSCPSTQSPDSRAWKDVSFDPHVRDSMDGVSSQMLSPSPPTKANRAAGPSRDVGSAKPYLEAVGRLDIFVTDHILMLYLHA